MACSLSMAQGRMDLAEARGTAASFDGLWGLIPLESPRRCSSLKILSAAYTFHQSRINALYPNYPARSLELQAANEHANAHSED